VHDDGALSKCSTRRRLTTQGLSRFKREVCGSLRSILDHPRPPRTSVKEAGLGHRHSTCHRTFCDNHLLYCNPASIPRLYCQRISCKLTTRDPSGRCNRIIVVFSSSLLIVVVSQYSQYQLCLYVRRATTATTAAQYHQPPPTHLIHLPTPARRTAKKRTRRLDFFCRARH
jgi:hypothetical protein